MRTVSVSAGLTWGRWVALCTLGEIAGFGLGGTIGFAVFTAVPDPSSARSAIGLLLGCIAAGVVEGAALGTAQWWALRRRYPDLRARSWIVATSGAAAAAWMLGGLPSTLASLLAPAGAPVGEPGAAAAAVAAATGGAVLGTLFGVLQWSVLRDHAERAASWIIANMLGWTLALPWSFAIGSSPLVTTPARAVVAIVGAGVIMGGLVAAATGAALRRMGPRIAATAR